MKKLLIRQLPKSFTQDDTIRLLKHFDAIDVFVFPAKGKMRNCAFATFADEFCTSNALRNLHQMNLSGTRLVVEYAKDKENSDEQCSTTTTNFDKSEFFAQLESSEQTNLISFPENSSSTDISSTISRITSKLYNQPEFFNRVLDLMNKLPNSQDDEEDKSTKSRDEKGIQCDLIAEYDRHNKSIEQDQTIQANQKFSENTKLLEIQKRKIKNSIEEASKRLKRKEKEMYDHIESSETVLTYFDNYADLKRIKSKLKLKDMNQIANQSESINQIETENFGFGTFTNRKESIGSEDEATIAHQSNTPSSSGSVIHSMFEKQLSAEELKNHAIFNNYSIGEPSCRLYLKNVDKKVTEQEIREFYTKLLDLNSELDLNAFEVNLFKKGKMNGQAFVRLPTEEQARIAIEKSNGLMLNRKPIYVCFARSSKPKE